VKIFSKELGVMIVLQLRGAVGLADDAMPDHQFRDLNRGAFQNLHEKLE